MIDSTPAPPPEDATQRPRVAVSSTSFNLLLGSFLFWALSIVATATAAIISTSHANRNNSNCPLRRREEQTTAYAEAADSALHEQCVQFDSDSIITSDHANRPLLLFKYARTGSTWLAWTGSKLRLQSGLEMTWIHETQKCMLDNESKEEEAADLATWLSEFFAKVPQEEALINTRENLKNGSGSKHVNHQCLVTAGKDTETMGSNIATLNPHASHEETPDLSDEQWAEIFEANPDLAMGVLVRTNLVKRAISGIAAEVQKEVCGSKKLHGTEDCIEKLPKTLRIEPQQLMEHIIESERKQIIVTEEAARLSRLYGDGKMFCLSYETMQLDLSREMKDLGDFLGAPITEASIEELWNEQHGTSASASYKRGSDDLREYLENYEEIRAFLSAESPCLLEQLEASEPRIFPTCGVWDGNDIEEDE